MDKIEIIDLDDEDDDSEEDIDEEDDEGEYEEHEEQIKKKTDRELMEGISSRLFSLETEMKHIREDLVDVYNLLLESVAEEE